MAGNILIHNYDGVDLEIVWDRWNATSNRCLAICSVYSRRIQGWVGEANRI